MTSTLRKAHLVVGAVTAFAFLITGMIMRLHEPPVASMEWAERLLFRSRHIYILCAGLVNLAIGALFGGVLLYTIVSLSRFSENTK